MEIAIIVAVAYILDLIFGDPPWLPHPVRGMGWLAGKLEPSLRRLIPWAKIAGVVFAVLVVGIVWLVSFGAIYYAGKLNPYLGIIVSSIFIYTALAAKDLKVEAMRVFTALRENNLTAARKNLSRIVGRDTDKLPPTEIIRATVETVAENTVDGIISPLFYAFIGGAPLALAFKAVSTLDSMVGYKNEKYKNFGWAAAKLDDLANFIPARISILFLSLAAYLTGHNGANAFKTALRDGGKNPSPNSGIPEAAVAGALNIRLGGTNFYNSVATIEPFIGYGKRDLNNDHIRESIRISQIAAGLSVLSGMGLILLVCPVS